MTDHQRAEIAYIISKMYKALTAMYVDNDCSNDKDCNLIDLHEGIDELEDAIQMLTDFMKGNQ